MALNKNWSRWIFASLTTWFNDHRDGLTMYVEGDDTDMSDLSDYIEYRQNGPISEELSKGWFRLDVLVNILVVSKRNDASIHTLHTNVGKVQAAFETNIPVYKFGDGPDDNRTQLLGCMVLCDSVETSLLGRVSSDIKEQQAMVEGHYCLFIEV